MDFFTVFTLGFKPIHGFAIIDHGRRKIIHTAATHIPTTQWLIQQFLNAFPGECPYKYLVCDNGRIFNDDFKRDVETFFNLKVVKTARYSPWQNGVMERLVGSCRREMSDHTIVLNERLLARLLSQYKEYYSRFRTHSYLCKDTPDGRPVEERGKQKKLRRISFLGGLQSAYHG